MILYKGKIYPNSEQNKLLESLYDDCLLTLTNKEKIDYNKVIDSCDNLYKRLFNHEFDDIVLPLLEKLNISKNEYLKAIALMSKDKLTLKVKNELPDLEKKRVAPLGILFHISAGNFDILPAYTVVEGLLGGNINILKLPTGDSGLSIKLLNCLIEKEPLLKDYIYVFDIPSIEIESIKKIMEFSNATVVWGGDEALKAVRENAPINSKIISWGHKLSFAYLTKDYKKQDLDKIAENICTTNQILCSSCQGIYLDTIDANELDCLAKKFFESLKKANKRIGNIDIGMIGKNTFELYSKSLEKDNNEKIYSEDGVSVVIKNDSELELSLMFKNVWIKKLPKNEIIKTLHKNKDYLQTVMLFKSRERDLLIDIFSSAGVTKISSLDKNVIDELESHDGEYPLRRYTKIVEIE